MKDWIEVFKTGRHTDSRGNVREWSEGDLDKIITASKDKDIPVVIGHPKSDDPAWGWVASVKKEAGSIWVKFKDIVPEFSEMVKKRMFTNRSIAINPEDMSLRHIGFLGAMPPAVKGLSGIRFSGDEAMMVIEFAEGSRLGSRLRSLMKEKNVTTADLARAGGIDESTMSAILSGNIHRPPDRRLKGFAKTLGVSFGTLLGLVPNEMAAEDESVIVRFMEKMREFFSNEDDVGAALPGCPDLIKEKSMSTFTQEELDQKLAEQKAEFSEEKKKSQTRITELETQATERKKATVKQAVSAFCTSLKKAGKLLPAWEGMGLQTFMEGLAETETVIEFAEGKKETQAAFFNRFLEALPKVVEFAEIAKAEELAGKSGGTHVEGAVDAERLELHNKAVAFQTANKDVTYIEAYKAIGGK